MRLLHVRILVLAAVAMILAAVGCAPERADPKEVAAVVNGEPIPRAEIDQQYERLVAKFREASPNLQFGDDKRQQMMQNFLDRAIRDKVILQEADRRGISIEDAEIDTRIEQLKKMFGGTPEGEARFMEGVQDMDDFRKRIADQIRISKVLEAGSQDAPAPGDAEIQAYYEENKSRFEVPETVTASHILAAFQDPAAGRPGPATPTADQKQAARERIDAAKAKLDAGTDFAEVAREFSQDPGSAPRGGELGAFRRGQMVPPFEEAAFALKPGEVSGIVETQYGYHIIKVSERAEGGQRSLDEVREEIVRSIQQRTRQESQNKFVEDLKAKAKIEIL